jgi:transcriptional regulator
MYRPPAYAIDDVATLRAFIRQRKLAIVAGIVDGQLHFAYAPVVLDAKAEPRGGVRFHLARANPLAACDGVHLRLSFLGPDAYVSPDWYETQGLVPTWNYVAVEGAGRARELDQPALRQLLADLSAQAEHELLPKSPWTLSKISEQRLSALMNAIRGFAVEFATLEGKFKLSQDKKPEDLKGVIAGLEARGDAANCAVATAMRAARPR